jgi:hypothetical protein
MRKWLVLARVFWPLIVVPVGILLMGRLGMGRYIPKVLPFTLALLVVPLLPLATFALMRLTGQKYSGMFADDQIVELAQRLARAKAACLERLEKPYPGSMKFRDEAAREQGNLFMTSANLRVYYTIDLEGKDFRHHMSMSNSRGPFALAAGQHIAAYLGELMSLDLPEIAAMWRGETTVFHISFSLDEAQQRQFALAPIHVPQSADLLQFRARAKEVVRKIREVGIGTLKDWRYAARPV